MQPSSPTVAVLDRLDRWLFRVEAVAVLILFPVLVAITFLQVICRYLLNYPLPWTEELAIGLFAWVAFIGSSLALAARGHFGLELVKKRLPRLPRILVELAIWAVSASFLVVVVRYGIVMVMAPAPTMTTLPISMRWFLAAVPVGAMLMLVHLCIQAWKAVLQPSTLLEADGLAEEVRT